MPRKTCETRTLRLINMQTPPVPKSWICPRIGLTASRPVPCRAIRRRARLGFAGNLRCLRLFNSARFFSIDTMDSPFAEPVKRTEFQAGIGRSEEHTSELQSQSNLVCRLLLEKKK